MMSDIGALLWKEVREQLQGGGRSRGKYMMVFMVLFYGVFFPLQSGRAWVDSYRMLLFGFTFSSLLVLSFAADTIAGERERHTLETLLASRLSARAIVLGKIASVILYGWGLTVAALLAGLITVNVEFDDVSRLTSLKEMLATLVFTFFTSALATGVGMLISLRSPTVKQAQQVLGIGWVAFAVVGFVVAEIMPASLRHLLGSWLATFSGPQALLFVLAVLLVLNAVILTIIFARFQRPRLILD